MRSRCIGILLENSRDIWILLGELHEFCPNLHVLCRIWTADYVLLFLATHTTWKRRRRRAVTVSQRVRFLDVYAWNKNLDLTKTFRINVEFFLMEIYLYQKKAGKIWNSFLLWSKFYLRKIRKGQEDILHENDSHKTGGLTSTLVKSYFQTFRFSFSVKNFQTEQNIYHFQPVTWDQSLFRQRKSLEHLCPANIFLLHCRNTQEHIRYWRQRNMSCI